VDLVTMVVELEKSYYLDGGIDCSNIDASSCGDSNPLRVRRDGVSKGYRL
jgi:hypothetical protein